MEAYITAKHLAAHFAISKAEAYIIMHEMESQGRNGLLRIGRLLRARPAAFEEYLRERMTNNDLQGKITNPEPQEIQES